MTACTRILHDYGSILFFDDVLSLKDIVILDPVWLYKVLSLVFTSVSQETRINGVADKDTLAKIFKRYPKSIHPHMRYLTII